MPGVSTCSYRQDPDKVRLSQHGREVSWRFMGAPALAGEVPPHADYWRKLRPIPAMISEALNARLPPLLQLVETHSGRMFVSP